jgi:hypothetical protein
MANQLLGRQLVVAQNFHSTPAQDYSHLTRNSEGKFNCTLIPGDGVGPELVIDTSSTMMLCMIANALKVS